MGYGAALAAGCCQGPGRELLAAAGEAARRQGCLLLEFYGACTKLLNFEFLATTAPARCQELGVRQCSWILFRQFRCTVETKSLMGVTS